MSTPQDMRLTTAPAVLVDGKMLCSTRKRALLSREALAQLAGVKLQTLRKLETGRTKAPHFATIKLLAAALGVKPEKLLKTPTPPPEILKDVRDVLAWNTRIA